MSSRPSSAGACAFARGGVSMAQQGGSLRAPVDSRLDRAKKTARATARTAAVVVAGAAALLTTSIAPVRAGDATTAGATATVPLFDGLGGFTRKVTTASPEAQRYFDQGLAFMYAFNHDEAIRAFRRAAELDPKCAMAWWGVAIANGPHINNPVVPPERAKAAWDALAAAKALATGASPVEQALIRAAESRYADPQPEDRKPLEQAYADAMRTVWKQYPDDADVGALFAESLIDLRPWDLWTADGQPQPGTEELSRDARDGDRAAPEAPARAPPLHPRRRGVAPAGEGRRRRGRAARPHARARPPRPHAVAHRRAARSLGGGDRRQREGDGGRPRVPRARAQPGLLPPLHGAQPRTCSPTAR